MTIGVPSLPRKKSALHAPIRDLEDSGSLDLGHPYHGSRPLVVPTTLRKANDFVACHHRHTGRTARNGGKFAIALASEGSIVAVAIVGNPLSATLMDGGTAEVLRLCTIPGVPVGSCSRLYAACWRAWSAMGGTRLVTYTLETEPGTSLKAAGWSAVGTTKPTGDGWRKSPDGCQRTDAAVLHIPKVRWQIGTPSNWNPK